VFYKILRSDTTTGVYTQIAEANGTSYDDTTAEPGKPYYYEVQGISSMGNNGVISNFDGGYTILAAPVLTASKGTSSTFIAVNWTTIPYAATYILLRTSSITGTQTEIWSGTTTSYNDSSTDVTGANAGKYFYYVVTAVSSYSLNGRTSTSDYGFANP